MEAYCRVMEKYQYSGSIFLHLVAAVSHASTIPPADINSHLGLHLKQTAYVKQLGYQHCSCLAPCESFQTSRAPNVDPKW